MVGAGAGGLASRLSRVRERAAGRTAGRRSSGPAGGTRGARSRARPTGRRRRRAARSRSVAGVVHPVDVAGGREAADVADVVGGPADLAEVVAVVAVERLELDALQDAEGAPRDVVVDLGELTRPPDDRRRPRSRSSVCRTWPGRTSSRLAARSAGVSMSTPGRSARSRSATAKAVRAGRAVRGRRRRGSRRPGGRDRGGCGQGGRGWGPCAPRCPPELITSNAYSGADL